jgi:hypothetical protein
MGGALPRDWRGPQDAAFADNGSRVVEERERGEVPTPSTQIEIDVRGQCVLFVYP